MELPECEHPIPTMGAPPPEKLVADCPPIPLEPDDEEDDETVPPGLAVDPGLVEDPELDPKDDPEPRLNPEEL
jgi:hypothetical protein